MREIEILFRGKRIDNGEWITDSETYIRDGDGIWLSDENLNVVTVIPETVGQYTGLTDKNGVRIFEGDIVGCVSDGERAVISWLKYFNVDKWEVIGNIHDNPELLETATKPAAKNIAQSGLAPVTDNFELMEG